MRAGFYAPYNHEKGCHMARHSFFANFIRFGFNFNTPIRELRHSAGPAKAPKDYASRQPLPRFLLRAK